MPSTTNSKFATSILLISALSGALVSAQETPAPAVPTETATFSGGLTAPTTGGDAVALTGRPQNRPTQSWSQWQPKPSYPASALPDQYMGMNRAGPNSEDQTGFNTCADGAWNQQSQCQTAWVNSLEDFCIWGPPEPGTIGDTERRAVAYCTQPNHGTRLIPDNTITGAHFVQTSEYVQVTGMGDFTSIGVPLGDTGGEMDSAGADDLSNPIGGVVYTTAKPSANGQPVMATEWTNFMSWNMFCIRACFGNNAERHCEHIYDVLGCRWNLPANYDPGFESCDGDLALFQGQYDQGNGVTSTFRQGDPVTPEPHPAPSSSNCQAGPSVSNGGLLVASPINAIAQNPNSSASSGASAATPAPGTGSSGSTSGASTNAGGNAANAAASSGSTPNAAGSDRALSTGATLGMGAAAAAALVAALFVA